MEQSNLRKAVANLLTPPSLIAVGLTIGITAMIMYSIEPPQWYVMIWSMSVGYFYKSIQVETQLQYNPQNVKGLS